MNSQDRKIVVGGWYTDSLGHVHHVCVVNESHIASCAWIETHYMSRDTRIEDFNVRPAVAVEVRRHVATEDQPEWAQENEENPLMTANDITLATLRSERDQLATKLRQTTRQLDESRRINAALLFDCDGSAADEPRMTLVERLESQAATIKQQREELDEAKRMIAEEQRIADNSARELGETRRMLKITEGRLANEQQHRRTAAEWSVKYRAERDAAKAAAEKAEIARDKARLDLETLSNDSAKRAADMARLLGELEISRQHHAATLEQLRLTDEELGKTREALRVTIRNDQEAISRLKNNMARVHRIATANRYLNPSVYDRIIELTT